MKISGTSYKFLILSLALFLGLCQGRPSLKVRHEVKLTKDSSEPLVRNACHGLSRDEALCRATFQERIDLAGKGEVNATDLALYGLGIVKTGAVLITNMMKNISQSSLAPQLQPWLSGCQKQYDPVDDLIKDAENAINVRKINDALKYTNAAIDNIELCDKVINATKERAENKPRDEMLWPAELKESNDGLKNLLIATANIIKAQES